MPHFLFQSSLRPCKFSDTMIFEGKQLTEDKKKEDDATGHSVVCSMGQKNLIYQLKYLVQYHKRCIV